MQENNISESLALSTLVKLSATALVRSKLEEGNKHAALNALRRFALCFLPEDEVGMNKVGDGSELSAYETAFCVINVTDSVELKALWYIFYPYLVAASPHLEETLYEETKKLLTTEEVLGAVLASRYRSLVYDCYEDLQAAGLAGMYVEWYTPYTQYRNTLTESGDTREIAQYKKLLAAGDFAAVASGTERLLDHDPYNCDVALLNIAARVSLLGGSSDAEDIKETIAYVDEFLSRNIDSRQQTYLHYYRALCLLALTASGQTEISGVKDELNECLEITPDFELAKFLLVAIAQKLESAN